jgi:uncharacterized protein (DUF488 family)
VAPQTVNHPHRNGEKVEATMTELLTIGYEGSTPEAFDAALVAAGVELVVDERAVAASRRRGFAKTALSDRLTGAGIRYLHLRELGDPKPGRDAARAGRWAEFRSIFSAHLATPEAIGGLARLSELAVRQRTALLCYEADATQCHRTIVAERVAPGCKLVVAHLQASPFAVGRHERDRTGGYLGEGRAAP